VVPDDSNYNVQYAAINYNAKAPQHLCVPIVSTAIEDELKSGSHGIYIIKRLATSIDSKLDIHGRVKHLH
jgi:hypothetical protein